MTLSRSELAHRLSPAEDIGLISSDKSYEVRSPLPPFPSHANAQVHLMEMDYPWSSESFNPGSDPFSKNWLTLPYKNPKDLDIKYNSSTIKSKKHVTK